uniref:Uncharacterized protein n=1 Tax=Rhizophora mucronata TaxID=61149 RepID=A0A2P2NWI3_RHIMU
MLPGFLFGLFFRPRDCGN